MVSFLISRLRNCAYSIEVMISWTVDPHFRIKFSASGDYLMSMGIKPVFNLLQVCFQMFFLVEIKYPLDKPLEKLPDRKRHPT